MMQSRSARLTKQECQANEVPEVIIPCFRSLTGVYPDWKLRHRSDACWQNCSTGGSVLIKDGLNVATFVSGLRGSQLVQGTWLVISSM